MGTVNGVRTTETTITFPTWGGWRASVSLESGSPLEGAVTLTVGSLSLVGTVQRSGEEFPGKPRITIRGGYGWQSLVAKPLSFQSDSGVRLRTVLSAVSSAAKQPIEQPTDGPIGNYFECIASRPSQEIRWCDVLNQMVRSGQVENWRVDPDGVTRFGPRSPVDVSVRATLLSQDPTVGLRTFGVDDPFQFLPGNMVSGVQISRSVIRETRDSVTVDVYSTGETATPSIADMIRRLLSQAFDDAIRTYVVAATREGGLLDLVPPASAPHLPEMRAVEQWSLGGCVYKASVGEEVAVAFLDSNKTRPIVIGVRLTTDDVEPVARRADLTRSGGPGTIVTLMPLTGAGMPPNNAIAAGIPCLISFGMTPPTFGSADPLYGSIMLGSTTLSSK